ncbi:uncharacterized protein LOC131000332 [Salvia miltiorrhiza]|uniref:uncharacterized protein LOC131000332 n=1 Tax=Salvia miltiorrhiza TaxID=226208 RepID=UPI0025AC799B|nr:uncharacterized protein LOC131000332 [Salvia miltiorrhiza]XP_057782176.1 uncharacterized protein LOC131000332 [Salvia miltiorrhiza]
MSPASKSKSKDKKIGKEAPKNSLKPLGHVNTSSGAPASGYNPVLGTFHTFESAPVPSASPLHVNGRFRNIDDTDDHNGSSSGTGVEYDSISNNGSWSGDSEDHKEKPSQPLTRQDIIPGADNDKREKIRQKNERKHQRQKERRAQELHERCSGYLMSRKLEALAQQLVAMGFSQERATMALILNEGRVEESVSWLFEGGEEDKKLEHNLDGGGNLKIDISDELARITDLEIRYKASKQEVERAVVSCEGDLDRAEESLKTQKEDPPAVPSKPDENGDTPTVANTKLAIAISQNSLRIQPKSTSATTVQQRRDDKDFNYTKVPTMLGSLVDPAATKSMQVLKKIPPKTDWAKPQQIAVPAEKRWVSAGSDPSASFSLASQSPTLTKTDVRYVGVGNELKNLQLGSVKEPVIVMQRPQSINAKQAPSTSISSSPPGPMAMSWYTSSGETMKPHGFVPSVAVSNAVSSNQLYSQPPYQSSQQQFMSSSGSMDSSGTKRANNGFWGRGGSPALAAPSSLGLFSCVGASGTSGISSQVDWSTGSSMLQFDYTNIDWSLDRGSVLPRPNGLWTGANYIQTNTRSYDSFAYGAGVKSAMRPGLSNGNGAAMDGNDPIAAASREWTSPFEEKDLFSLPRQVVSSPTL